MKNKTILLINPPSDKHYYISVQPPLGLLYIASYLRKYKLSVSVLDLNVERRWGACLKTALKEYSPGVVGLTSNFSNRFTTRKISSLIKNINPRIQVVAGGPHPTVSASDYYGCGIDYIIPFEAERRMLEFVLSEDKNNLKGIIPCDQEQNNTIFSEENRELISDLDTLPFPAYDLVNIERYYINSLKKKPIVSMITSRGCPGQCVFCSQAVFGRKWRARSAGNVVEEMLWLKEKIGAQEISIEDDNFTLDLERAHEICRLLISKKAGITWQLANGIRADKMTKELLKEMKTAGCWKLAIAPEVGDEKSLLEIKKGIALQSFRQVAQWCRELGIVYYGFFLMGFPFQTERDLKLTIDFALELNPLLMDLSKVVPFKGTTLFEEFTKTNDLSRNNITSYYDKRNNVTLEKYFRKAYMRFYGRLEKISEILKVIGPRQFFRLIRYGMEVFC